MTLRVLLDLSLVSSATLPRGVRRYVHLLAEALMQRKGEFDLEVMALIDAPLLRAPRHTSDLTAAIEAWETKPGTALPLPFGRRSVRHLAKAARAAGAEVVHSLHPESSPRSALDCARVVTCHHLDSTVAATEWHGGQSRVDLDRRHFQRAERIIAISRATAQELIARLDVPRHRISVVHNGIDPSVWSAGARPDDGPRLAALGLRGGPYLLCVGAVDARKNVDGILQGLKRAQALVQNRQLILAWVGPLSRVERLELDGLCKSRGVSSSVMTVGLVSDADLGALYRHATGLVFASRREGFGFPVIEAMASGCPVITSNRSSMVEIADGAAVMVDPEDTGAIADAMVLLYGDAAQRERLRQAGAERAGQFTLERMVSGTAIAYREAASAARASSSTGSDVPAREQDRIE
jgi:glycosyltransferase involved in cell wall biosynthesis